MLVKSLLLAALAAAVAAQGSLKKVRPQIHTYTYAWPHPSALCSLAAIAALAALSFETPSSLGAKAAVPSASPVWLLISAPRSCNHHYIGLAVCDGRLAYGVDRHVWGGNSRWGYLGTGTFHYSSMWVTTVPSSPEARRPVPPRYHVYWWRLRACGRQTSEGQAGYHGCSSASWPYCLICTPTIRRGGGARPVDFRRGGHPLHSAIPSGTRDRPGALRSGNNSNLVAAPLYTDLGA